MHTEDILRIKENTTRVNTLQELELEQSSLLKDIDRLLRIKLITPSVKNIQLLKSIINNIKK